MIWFQVDMLEAEVDALKALVLTSTPSSPNRHLHPQLLVAARKPPLSMLFIMWMFFKRKSQLYCVSPQTFSHQKMQTRATVTNATSATRAARLNRRQRPAALTPRLPPPPTPPRSLLVFQRSRLTRRRCFQIKRFWGWKLSCIFLLYRRPIQATFASSPSGVKKWTPPTRATRFSDEFMQRRSHPAWTSPTKKYSIIFWMLTVQMLIVVSLKYSYSYHNKSCPP